MQFFNRFISAPAYNAKAQLMRTFLENYYEHTDSLRSLCPIQPLPSLFPHAKHVSPYLKGYILTAAIY